MPYFRARFRTRNNDGSTATTETVFKEYDATLTNAQAQAPFEGSLTTAQATAKRAECSTTEPTQSGFHAVSRRADITVTVQ